MCVSAGKAGLVGCEQLVGYVYRAASRGGLLSGLALTGAVCCASQCQLSLFHHHHHHLFATRSMVSKSTSHKQHGRTTRHTNAPTVGRKNYI